MRAVIHQPNLLPRLKVLQKIAAADIWVVLDSVQYCKREWQNRTRIVSTHGNNQNFWLTAPVHCPTGQKTLIMNTTLVNPEKTLQLIKNALYYSFRPSLHWKVIDDFINRISDKLVYKNLTSLCLETTLELLKIAGHNPNVVLSSKLSVEGKSSNLMAKICKHINVSTYLADSGARNYLDPAHFHDINVLWQDWKEPKEKWCGINSWRNISCLNYLSRVGREQFKRHISTGKFISNNNWNIFSTD